MKEKGTNAFFPGLLYNNVCCQPQDEFSMFFAGIERGAIHISLPSPASKDLWNLLDLISSLIFPCLGISITLCKLRVCVQLRQYHQKKKIKMMNSLNSGPYYPVSSASNILKPSHSESFEIKEINKARESK